MGPSGSYASHQFNPRDRATMTLSSRQLIAIAAVVAVAFAFGLFAKEAAIYLMVVGIIGAVGVLVAGVGSSGKDLTSLPAALSQVARGERPALPANAPPQLAQVYDIIGDLAQRIQVTQNTDRQYELSLETITRAAEDAQQGRRPSVPKDASQELRRVLQVMDELATSMRRAQETDAARSASLRAIAPVLQETATRLSEGLRQRTQLTEETTNAVTSVTAALRDLAQHVEVLARSAEESSGSILEMTTINNEVASNVAELGSSVRETASSIEEMAYSIKEVAKNVDALALTAEETSSSMNEMDVSIDQVQSNANETARLSEEVAQDAQRGAESILKTIGEIYRIKASTHEAVSVISNLGSRIDAIGQILNVIDDVAEQTNLLALNAAIIAAQAGEHGKGFAVVADEIKDLAERAGASTKEIAELTKTIQNESRNAVAAVERGAKNVDRGVEVSNEAEHALKKILESSQKSTNMVRAIARATVEQAKGSRQVTDAIGRIAETVQQIAAATAQQARGSELIMRSAEKMRSITQHVERSSQEQARGGRQVTQSIENISQLASQLHEAHRSLSRSGESLLGSSRRIEESIRQEEPFVRKLQQVASQLQEPYSN